MSKLTATVGMLVAAAAVATMWAAEPVNRVRDFMRPKLSHSQKVLEGLTSEDFEMIAKNAQAMSLLSQESQWQVLETPDYARQSQEFRRLADQLTDAARQKNLDGATLAYVQLTLKCVQCHKYVRDQER
jgi:hypothetical protein